MPNPSYIDTVTIYNRYKALNSTETWFRTVLHNVFYKSSIVQTVTGSNILTMASSYILRIPESGNYANRESWEAMDDKAGHFTLGVDDIIVLGEVSDTVTATSPNTATNLLTKYKPDAFRIKSFSDNSRMVGGHYRVNGV
ncbi:DUF6751 family protein [Parasporobacterium paucivorans]|uniref:Uncharacterized protein n=1 Tax=Parasporobacterium paucivorans DSM 15970 TaxID=1122934 RepID=A0A1M6B256_9FIRM|nr:DUF6751 family protein [Parasporobacterium paucivorans]SHI42822.1 hypothetical protein SAMN02745691_00240 [Parasporobacterium paucivorans DSM 15970]